MIVPAMTEWEVVRDAVKDFPALNRKMQRPMELLARRHKKGDRKGVLDEIHPRPREFADNASGAQLVELVDGTALPGCFFAIRIPVVAPPSFTMYDYYEG